MTCVQSGEAASPRGIAATATCGAASAEEPDETAELMMHLRHAREELAAMDRAESMARMRFEDDLARCQALLEARGREVLALERQLADAEEVGADADPSAGDITRELEAVESETHMLTSDVYLWERTVEGLSLDLDNSLEYLVAASAGAGGGPSQRLGLHDCLPEDLCAKLELSTQCAARISSLRQKHLEGGDALARHLRREAASSYAPHTSAASVRSAPPRVPKYRERRPSDETAQVGLLGAGLELIDPSVLAARKSSSSSTRPSTNFRTFSTDDLAPPFLVAADYTNFEESPWTDEDDPVETKVVPWHFDGEQSRDLPEEGHLLREGLDRELRQLDELMFLPTVAESGAEVRLPMRDLLRAAARGDIPAVKVWLSCVEGPTGGRGGELLGWTAWHVAAAHGQCGVLECLKEDMVESATHFLAALDQRTSIMGLPPLGVACLRGQVEAARSLLICMAPVNSRDARGNTPLLWAACGERSQLLVPLLLEARGDPDVANGSGLRVNLARHRWPRDAFSPEPRHKPRAWEDERAASKQSLPDDAIAWSHFL